MGEERGSLEGNFLMRRLRPFLGLRALKRHGMILIVAGFMYTLIGVAYILASPAVSRTSSLALLLAIAPLDFWGGVFIFAGVLVMISSKWPPFAETWGYMVLTGLSTGWGTAYLMGIIFMKTPLVNISGFLIWSLFGFLWWAISGLLNPDRTGVADNARPD